jgi:hypothetical protein
LLACRSVLANTSFVSGVWFVVGEIATSAPRAQSERSSVPSLSSSRATKESACVRRSTRDLPLAWIGPKKSATSATSATSVTSAVSSRRGRHHRRLGLLGELDLERVLRQPNARQREAVILAHPLEQRELGLETQRADVKRVAAGVPSSISSTHFAHVRIAPTSSEGRASSSARNSTRACR